MQFEDCSGFMVSRESRSPPHVQLKPSIKNFPKGKLSPNLISEIRNHQQINIVSNLFGKVIQICY